MPPSHDWTDVISNPPLPSNHNLAVNRAPWLDRPPFSKAKMGSEKPASFKGFYASQR